MHIRKCFLPLELTELNTSGKALQSKSTILVACFLSNASQTE